MNERRLQVRPIQKLERVEHCWPPDVTSRMQLLLSLAPEGKDRGRTQGSRCSAPYLEFSIC